MNILVTGGLGFIGSHFIGQLIKTGNADTIYNIDSMGYGSNPRNLENITDDRRYIFIKEDTCNIIGRKLGQIDVIVNIAAQTHVDRSIADPEPFVHSNYIGTFRLLEYARRNSVKRFVQVSTDEVYGEAKDGYSFEEEDILSPRNPYSATKAGADILVRAYCNTYGMDAVITRCTNNFGPNQFPEKLIPKTIIRILSGKPIILYGNGLHVRDWLYVEDHVQAIKEIMLRGKSGNIYNISAYNSFTNLEIVQKIRAFIKEQTQIYSEIRFTTDRPGHDVRYSLDSSKLRSELGWKPIKTFEQALVETIEWYLRNEDWWKPLSNEDILHPQPWSQNWSSQDDK